MSLKCKTCTDNFCKCNCSFPGCIHAAETCDAHKFCGKRGCVKRILYGSQVCEEHKSALARKCGVHDCYEDRQANQFCAEHERPSPCGLFRQTNSLQSCLTCIHLVPKYGAGNLFCQCCSNFARREAGLEPIIFWHQEQVKKRGL